MPESQSIEYKLSWRDEYLKWICAFANAKGGKLYIGINDKGVVTGISESKKLLDDLPNKIIQQLGIMPEVNLLRKNKLHYIEIIVQPSSVPISFQGGYYYRSGSTKQELKGALLQQFLLTKNGKSWDELPVNAATLKDIDPLAIQYFTRYAIGSKRLPLQSKSETPKSVLEKLNLISPEGKITHAALLIFGKKPQRFFANASFKIGRFGKDDSDLLFQDVVEGNILQMADQVMDILRAKYLTSPISYNGLQRIETLEYPEDALREAILNAIVHKDYTGTSIQLSVYNNKLILWNEGKLPSDLSIKKLLGKHPSRPRNKRIAEVFFKAGFIEVWGRGIAKINDALTNAKLPKAKVREFAGGIEIELKQLQKKHVTENVTENVTEKRKQLILQLMHKNPNITTTEIASNLSVTRRTIARDIEQLKVQQKVKRKGTDKSGSWEINN